MSYDRPGQFTKPRPCGKCEKGIARNGARVCDNCRKQKIKEDKAKYDVSDLPSNTGAVRHAAEMSGRKMFDVGFSDDPSDAYAMRMAATTIGDDDCGPLIVPVPPHDPDAPWVDS